MNNLLLAVIAISIFGATLKADEVKASKTECDNLYALSIALDRTGDSDGSYSVALKWQELGCDNE